MFKKNFFHRQKICRFCKDKTQEISYKDVKTLRYFITERGKIIPRRISGNCSKHQRVITRAVKKARQIALIAYSAQNDV